MDAERSGPLPDRRPSSATAAWRSSRASRPGRVQVSATLRATKDRPADVRAANLGLVHAMASIPRTAEEIERRLAELEAEQRQLEAALRCGEVEPSRQPRRTGSGSPRRPSGRYQSRRSRRTRSIADEDLGGFGSGFRLAAPD